MLSLSLLSSIHPSITFKARVLYTHTYKMTSALVSSSSCASTTTVCSRLRFQRKSSTIQTTKRYVLRILSRGLIFSLFLSLVVFPPILTDVVQNFLLFYSLIIHRRISITPRAENDSASTTTPAASAAPKLVPSNAASIKVNECIRLEKFWFFCFLDQNRFFFASLSRGRSCLSLSSLLQQSDDKSSTRASLIFCVGSVRAFSCACHACIRRENENENILKN